MWLRQAKEMSEGGLGLTAFAHLRLSKALSSFHNRQRDGYLGGPHSARRLGVDKGVHHPIVYESCKPIMGEHASI